MKQLKINCTKNGIRVYGANNIGSTCDTDAGTRQDFMRIAEHWWNTYCEGYGRPEAKTSGQDALADLLDELRSGEYAPLADRVESAVNANREHALEVLNRVHDFLGVLCRDGRCDDHCSECIGASDLADDVWDVIHGIGKKDGAK